MIKSTEQNIRLADQADGATQHLDVEELRERLAEAFQTCGIRESWVPDDLLDVLERRLRENGGAAASLLDCNEIYRMLVESLNATGFADVANAFLKQEESPADDESAARRPWSQEDLRGLLAETPWAPMEDTARAQLAHAAAEALARLAIPGGTTAQLALEVARNLMAAEEAGGAMHGDSAAAVGMEAAGAPRPLGCRPRYIAADQWALTASAQLQELMRLRILRPCPASDILPVAVVECNLVRIFDLAQPPRQEDELVALLASLCNEVKSLLAQMHARMAQCWPAQQTAGSRLLFNRYGAFLKLACPSRRRKELSALKERLAALWAARLEGPSVSLCFPN